MRLGYAICFLFIVSVASARTITCDFYGQLGNQLFQAAATIAYGLENGYTPVFPDLLQAIRGDLNHRYILHELDVASLDPNETVYFHDHDQITDTFFYAPIPKIEAEALRLHGHFCSEKYFEKYADTIRKLFAPTEEVLSLIHEKYSDLFRTPTVALHIRTFLPDGHRIMHTPQALLPHRWHYYLKAMALFPNNSHFLVFADDVKWAKENFPKTHYQITFIEDNPHYIDFYMISLCDHQITAPDSTFSWWAAWLNPNPHKIVTIADICWGHKRSDMLPVSWKKIARYPPHFEHIPF